MDDISLAQALQRSFSWMVARCAGKECSRIEVGTVLQTIPGSMRLDVFIAACAARGWVIWGDGAYCPSCWSRGKAEVIGFITARHPTAKELRAQLKAMAEAQREMSQRCEIKVEYPPVGAEA